MEVISNMNQELSGTIISKEITNNLLGKCNGLKLVILQLNNDDATNSFIKVKKNKCSELGIECIVFNYDESIQEEDIINKIKELNNDNTVNGIMIELPIYSHLNRDNIINSIDSNKDVDGLKEDSVFIPSTVRGIETLINYYNIDLNNKNILIINRSKLIGIPLYNRLVNKGYNVKVGHSKTDNLKELCLESDIIITATGNHFIDDTYLKDNAVVIDAGTSFINNKIVGDLVIDSLTNRNISYTKTPGGIGPLTVISLIQNLYENKKDITS